MARTCALAAALLALAGEIALAVPRLGPPSAFMVEDRHRSAVVEVVELLEDGRFRARTLERLFGETPDEIVLRGTGPDLIEVGGTYLVGHTDKPARRTPRWDTDPAGPRVLSVPAVGPAVFETSTAMRLLVAGAGGSSPPAARRRLDAVLDQLVRPDVQSRRFASAELALSPDLRELAGTADLAVVQRVLDSDQLEPLARDLLLQAVLEIPASSGAAWPAAHCRRVVAAHGPELELASFVPSLIVTALECLERTGDASDAGLARRHVASNNPGVGKAAFAAMAALDADLAAALAPGYLADERIHADTRRFVQRLADRLGPGDGER